MRTNRLVFGAAVVLSVAMATQADGLRRVDGARIVAADSGADAEWVSYGRTYSEQRYSPLAQINQQSVGKLGLAWWAQVDTDRGQEATPLVADAVIYVSTAWSKVYAFDALTGHTLWMFDPKVDGAKAFDACCDVVNRGVALWQDKVYLGALDGRLIALDRETGKQVWATQTTDTTRPYSITGAPRVVKGKVLIGQGGADFGVRGYVSAYDADTGKLSWRFYLAPNPAGKPDGATSDKIFAEKANATWSGETWKLTGGGGAPYDAIVYDPVTDLVYVGTGNGSPWNHLKRSDGKGDNLFLASIVALKPETGDYVWHYQVNPGESWDFNAAQPLMLADLTINEEKRHVLMQAPKNGFFYVLDAATGKLISAESFVPEQNWAERIDLATGRPVERPGVRYVDAPARVIPGPRGAHNWTPMALNPKLGLVYIPSIISAFSYSDPATYTYQPVGLNIAQAFAEPRPGATPQPPAPANTSSLIAWDPVAQKARWRVQQSTTFNGGLLATGGDLVFGGAGSALNAYAAEDGRVLWSYPTQAWIIAPPITYRLDGEQYVAVMQGVGGTVGVNGKTASSDAPPEPRRPGRLMVFKLGATAQEAPFPPQERPPIVAATQAEASTGDAAVGAKHYQAYCFICHTGSGFLPDLRRSPMMLSRAAFKHVVYDGTLRRNGMRDFKDVMSEGEVESIRAFLIQRNLAGAAAPAALGH